VRRAAGLPVIIVGATSGYLDPAPRVLARPMPGDYSNARAEEEGGGTPVAGYFMTKRYSVVDGPRNLSSHDTFCVDREPPLVTEAGVPVYWDREHFTCEGVDLIVRICPRADSL